jgi:hypothetical protein
MLRENHKANLNQNKEFKIGYIETSFHKTLSKSGLCVPSHIKNFVTFIGKAKEISVSLKKLYFLNGREYAI